MIRAFFAGFFLFNAIPHLVKGITGETHMTPFKRVSSPYLNILWSFVNIFFGLIILEKDPVTGNIIFPAGMDLWVFILGGFLLALSAAWLFGRPNARLPWHKD